MSHATETLTRLGAIGQYAGSGTISAAASIYLASRSGTRPISGLLQGAFQHGADTDTLASMTGGLLGAIHGHDWLGQLRDVQDSHYLADVADGLVTGREYSLPEPPSSPRIVTRELEDDFRDGGTFVDGRRYEVVGRAVLSERPWAARFLLRLEEGQTVTVDRLHRLPPDQPKFNEVPHLSQAEEERDRPQLVEPPITPQVPGNQITVTLPVSSLGAIARFYSELLQRQLVIEGNYVVVSDALQFVGAQRGPALWSADAHIEIRVPDLREVAAKLSLSLFSDRATDLRASAVDPEGRSVTIRELHP